MDSFVRFCLRLAGVALLLERPYLRAGELLYIFHIFSIYLNVFRFPRREIDNGTEMFVYTSQASEILGINRFLFLRDLSGFKDANGPKTHSLIPIPLAI